VVAILNRPVVLAAGILLSLTLHTVGLLWWLSRPQEVLLPMAAAPLVTVDLFAPAMPVSEPEVRPANVQPAVEEPAPKEPEYLPAGNGTVQPVPKPHRVVTRIEKKPAPHAEPSAPAAQPSAVAPETAPANPVPVPAPITDARYDAAYLKNPAPAYPPLSRRLGEEGRVLLRVHVLADGKVLAVELKTSSGFPRLDEAARAAVEKWRFVPARQGETTVDSRVDVPIRFSLQK
jgi:protein TonB